MASAMNRIGGPACERPACEYSAPGSTTHRFYRAIANFPTPVPNGDLTDDKWTETRFQQFIRSTARQAAFDSPGSNPPTQILIADMKQRGISDSSRPSRCAGGLMPSQFPAV